MQTRVHTSRARAALGVAGAVLAAAGAGAAPVVTAPVADLALAAGGAVAVVDLRTVFGLEGVAGPDDTLTRWTTDFGVFDVRLRPDAAPLSVANFLAYVDAGRYANTVIHRAPPDFVIQGGAFTASLPLGNVATFAAIPLEYSLPNARGTLAMARTDVPDSATSSWYFNTVDNTVGLGPGGFSPEGYAVFGEALPGGLTVIDAIAAVPVYTGTGVSEAFPLKNYTGGAATLANLVVIQSVVRATVYPAAGSAAPAALAFSAVSSDPDLLGVAVVGSELRLTPAAGRSGTATVTLTATDVRDVAVQEAFAVAVQPPLVNLATRGYVGTGDAVMIAGFVIGGTGDKQVLVRAVGPKLADFGLADHLPNPRLRIVGPGGAEVAVNEDWDTAGGGGDNLRAVAAAVGAFPLDDGSLDAAWTGPLAPGAYTAIVEDAGGASGLGIVEVYDADLGAGSRLVNLSTRVPVGEGDAVAIPGIVVRGAPRTFLIRAVGSAVLAAPPFDVPGTMPDPRLRVVRTEGGANEELAANDDWGSGPDPAAVVAAAVELGAFPLPDGSADAALLITLQPGAHTVLVEGGTGIALVEVYEQP